MIVTGTADEHLLNRCSTNNSNSNNNLTMERGERWETLYVGIIKTMEMDTGE